MNHPPTSPLRPLRQRARLTLDQLAFELRVDGSTLSRAERGFKPLRPELHEQAIALCNAVLAAAPEARTPA